MKPLIIHTVGDGRLGDTLPQQVAEIAQLVAASRHSVIHLHGGLVTKESATKSAKQLSPFYERHELLSLFFVWESGLVETLRNNPREIFEEKIFRALLKRILKWAGGKLVDPTGGRTPGSVADPLDDGTVEIAIAEAQAAAGADRVIEAKEPLSELPEAPDIAPLKTAEEERFVRELRESQEFREAFDALMLGLAVEAPPGRSVSPAAAPRTSLISEPIKAELRQTATEGQRGLFDPATMIVRAVACASLT